MEKNILNTSWTCGSCHHSVHKKDALYCEFWQSAADRPCGQFVYEPGTDEVERDDRQRKPAGKLGARTRKAARY
jgi:hypothetical protein